MRVRPGGSLNAFFYVVTGVFSQRYAMVRKEGKKHNWKYIFNRKNLICKVIQQISPFKRAQFSQTPHKFSNEKKPKGKNLLI